MCKSAKGLPVTLLGAISRSEDGMPSKGSRTYPRLRVDATALMASVITPMACIWDPRSGHCTTGLCHSQQPISRFRSYIPRRHKGQ